MVVPLPSRELTSIRPPCSCTMRYEIAIPNPVPLGKFVRKGWKMRATSDSDMPRPLSVKTML